MVPRSHKHENLVKALISCSFIMCNGPKMGCTNKCSNSHWNREDDIYPPTSVCRGGSDRSGSKSLRCPDGGLTGLTGEDDDDG